jgi:hypothetical protein
MKKQFIFLLFLLLPSENCFGHFIQGFGIKFGSTNAKQYWEYSPEINVQFSSNARWGWNCGFFAEFLDLSYLKILAETVYTQKGMKYEFEETSSNDPTGTGHTKIINNRLDYVGLRFLGKINFQNPKISPYFLVGFRLDYQINQKIEHGFEVIYEKFEKNIQGISAGAGIELEKTISIPIMAEIVYNYDITIPYQTENLYIKNSDFEIRIGIRFR